MNLRELQELIDAIPADEDELRDYYLAKRAELVDSIKGDLKAKGLYSDFSLSEILAVSGYRGRRTA